MRLLAALFTVVMFVGADPSTLVLSLSKDERTTRARQQSGDVPLAGIETMIPMRDGVRLYTQVYSPKQPAGPLPIILLRTPYGTGPSWNDFVRHPDYDAFWKRQAFAPWLTRVTAPTLNVAGWWDQEDFYGPLKIYDLLERNDAAHENFLVVGPWNHGGWSSGEGRKLGRVDFGSATAAHYRQNILAPFFAYYLKGKGKPPVSEALTFRTGVNEWVQHDAWPPVRNIVDRRLYLHGGEKLSFDPPPAADAPAFDSYVSDPANPVPYRPRPIRLNIGWTTWHRKGVRLFCIRRNVTIFQ